MNRRQVYTIVTRIVKRELVSRIKTRFPVFENHNLFAEKAYEFLLRETHRETKARRSTNSLKVYIRSQFSLKKRPTDLGMHLDSNGSYAYVSKNC